jgi:hypothetical protein
MVSRKSEPSSELLEEIEVNGITLQLGMEVYHARIIPQTGICYVQTLKVRTIFDKSFVGLDTVSKTAQYITNNNIGVTVFLRRADANKVILDAQKSGKIRKFKEVDKGDD